MLYQRIAFRLGFCVLPAKIYLPSPEAGYLHAGVYSKP